MGDVDEVKLYSSVHNTGFIVNQEMRINLDRAWDLTAGPKYTNTELSVIQIKPSLRAQIGLSAHAAHNGWSRKPSWRALSGDSLAWWAELLTSCCYFCHVWGSNGGGRRRKKGRAAATVQTKPSAPGLHSVTCRTKNITLLTFLLLRTHTTHSSFHAFNRARNNPGPVYCKTIDGSKRTY